MAMSGAERQRRYMERNPMAKRKKKNYMRDYMRYRRSMRPGTKNG